MIDVTYNQIILRYSIYWQVRIVLCTVEGCPLGKAKPKRYMCPKREKSQSFEFRLTSRVIQYTNKKIIESCTVWHPAASSITNYHDISKVIHNHMQLLEERHSITPQGRVSNSQMKVLTLLLCIQLNYTLLLLIQALECGKLDTTLVQGTFTQVSSGSKTNSRKTG